MRNLCAGTDGAAADASRFWRHAAVATAARLLLAASDWAPVLQRRVEVATPANSLLRFRCSLLSPPLDQPATSSIGTRLIVVHANCVYNSMHAACKSG